MENNMTNNIEGIISESKKELENMPYYNEFNKQYDDLSTELKNTLTETQIKTLNDIIKIFSTIKNYESYIAYRLGYADGIKYKNNDPKKSWLEGQIGLNTGSFWPFFYKLNIYFKQNDPVFWPKMDLKLGHLTLKFIKMTLNLTLKYYLT